MPFKTLPGQSAPNSAIKIKVCICVTHEEMCGDFRSDLLVEAIFLY